MTKQEEIGILKSLQGDTYFAQAFGQDIDQMCVNIKNDYGIMLDTTFALHLDSLESALKKAKATLEEAQKQHAEELATLIKAQDKEMKDFVLCLMEKNDDERYEMIEQMFGRVFSLRCKYAENSELSPSEMYELFEMANQ